MVQKNAIARKLKENLEEESMMWARNFIAAEYHGQFPDDAKSQKEVAAAKHNMEETMKRIVWLESYLKKMK